MKSNRQGTKTSGAATAVRTGPRTASMQGATVRRFLRIAQVVALVAATTLVFGTADTARAAIVPCTPDPGFTDCLRYSWVGTSMNQPFVVPAGVTSIDVRAWGEGGHPQTASGGGGGFARGTVAVTPDAALRVAVGVGRGGNAGGFSGLFLGPGLRGNPQIIAGGGGGAGAATAGGAGGGLTGSPGAGAGGGSGGTQTEGGAVNGGSYGDLSPGQQWRGGAGSYFYGGNGGGGGGGYFGGGGGAWDKGGGGGSSFIGGSAVSNGSTEAGSADQPGGMTDTQYVSGIGRGDVADDNGQVVIQWVQSVPTTIQTPPVVADHEMITFAGSGVEGFVDGPASSAQFSVPFAIARRGSDVIVGDASAVRSIAPNGDVTTIAGSSQSGYLDGQGTAAQFRFITGLAVAPDGTIYVSDTDDQRIRAISPTGAVTTVAGNGSMGSVDGSASTASFDQPNSIVLAATGDLFVTENNGGNVRRVTPSGDVTTVLVSEYATSIELLANGNLLIGSGLGSINEYTTAGTLVREVAGLYGWGLTDGPARTAEFGSIESTVTRPDGSMYVGSDSAVRWISPDAYVTTVAGAGGSGYVNGVGAATTKMSVAAGLLADGTDFLVADPWNHVVRRLNTSVVVPTTTTTVPETTTTTEPETTTTSTTTTVPETTTTTLPETTTTVATTTTTEAPTTTTSTTTTVPETTTIPTTTIPATTIPTTTTTEAPTTTVAGTTTVPSTTTAPSTTAPASTTVPPTTAVPATTTTAAPTTTTTTTTTTVPTTTTTVPTTTTTTAVATTTTAPRPTTTVPATTTPPGTTTTSPATPATTRPTTTTTTPPPPATTRPAAVTAEPASTTTTPPSSTTTDAPRTTSSVTSTTKATTTTSATTTSTPRAATSTAPPAKKRIAATTTTRATIKTTTTTRPSAQRSATPSNLTSVTTRPSASTTTPLTAATPTTAPTTTTSPTSTTTTTTTVDPLAPAKPGDDNLSPAGAAGAPAAPAIDTTAVDTAAGTADTTLPTSDAETDAQPTSDAPADAASISGGPELQSAPEERPILLALDVRLGAEIAGGEGNVEATGLKPGSELIVEVHSTPIEVARIRVDASGTAKGSFTMPAELENGDHRVVGTGVRADGVPIGQDLAFSLKSDRLSAVPTLTKTYVRTDDAPSQLGLFEPLSSTPDLLQLPAQVFAAVAAAGAAAAAATRRGGSRVAGSRSSSRGRSSGPGGRSGSSSDGSSSPASSESGEYTEIYAADAVFWALDAEDPNLAIGDRSRTWRWAGTERLDRWSRDVPDRVNRVSPLLARAIADGQWLRAVLGTAALIVPVIGAVLGVFAGMNTGGSYLPPAFAWVVALMLLGIVDAGAGMVACATYTATIVALGGVPSNGELKTTAGLLMLWFGPILGAAMMRPARRAIERSTATRLERAGDLLFGPMFGAWTAQNAAWAQSALTGRELPIAEQVGTITVIALFVVLARYLAESAVLRWYPLRAERTDCGEPDTPSRLQQIGSVALRALMFGWIATSFVPLGWQVVFGATALALSVLAYAEWINGHLPNIAALHRLVPGEVTLMFLILAACDVVTRRLPSWEPDASRQVLMGLVYYGIPTMVLTAVIMLGREGKRPEWRPWHSVFAVPMAVLLAKFMFAL